VLSVWRTDLVQLGCAENGSGSGTPCSVAVGEGVVYRPAGFARRRSPLIVHMGALSGRFLRRFITVFFFVFFFFSGASAVEAG
jgi:hypothetical protein